MTNTLHKITVSWGARSQSLGAVIAQIGDYLDVLRASHPEFNGFKLLTPTGYEVGTAPGAALAQLMLRRFNEGNGASVDASGAYDLRSAQGFTFYLYTAAQGDDERGYVPPGTVEVAFNVGGGHSNSVSITVRRTRPDLAEYGLLRRLLLVTVDHWHATLGHIADPEFRSAVSKRLTKPGGRLRAGWMTYFRNEILAACIRPPVNWMMEKSPDGDAILFTFSERAPSAANPDDVGRTVAMQEWLDRFGYAHEWSVFGWPYDEADERYAHQITGAPPGAAYVVGFVPFDGYDHVRKVLLFARVFRLPDSWGTDLHISRKNDPAHLEASPYVVQARQHIAAVRYVDGSTPIEWHVGDEAKARNLQVLLNDWASIPESLLKVIYTPYEGVLPPKQ